MAISRKRKEEILASLLEKLASSELVILTGYKGLKAAEMAEVRNRLRGANAKFEVVKNALGLLALREAQLAVPEDLIDGTTAWSFCQGDVAPPVKTLTDFIKGYKEALADFGIKGAIMGRRVLNAKQVAELAKMPPKEVLLAQVVGTFQSPISGLVNVLSGPIRGLVNVLNGRVEQLKQAA